MDMTRVLKAMTILTVFTAMTVAQVKNVAVVETDVDAASGASAEITSADVRQVTAELRREAVKNLPSDKYNIMTSETVQAQGSAVLEECAEENCVIALGSRIGADYIVRGTISKLRTRFTLTVEVYETENGNLVASSAPVRSETIEDLVEKAEAACEEMFGKFVSTQGSKQKPRTKYTLGVSADPVNGGTVLRSPKKDEYAAGEVVNVVAVPSRGYVFTGWLGASTEKVNSVTVTMNANKVLMAKFALQSGSADAAESTEMTETAPESAQAAAMMITEWKPKNRVTLGVGSVFTNKFGGDIRFYNTSGDDFTLSMPYSCVGLYSYIDLIYMELHAGYSIGGGDLTYSDNSGEDNMGVYVERSIISGGISFKWPIDVWKVKIFPILGVDFEVTYGLRIHLNVDYTSERSLGNLWLKSGGGVDYRVVRSAYARFEALYGLAILGDDDDIERSAYYDFDRDVKVKHGFTLKAGVGFDF